jgi:hypothetical protein
MRGRKGGVPAYYYAGAPLVMDATKWNRVAILLLAAGLLAIAGFEWLAYVSQGIAYGAIVGLRGREKDLAEIGSSALRALGLAALLEGLAIGLASWAFTDDGRPVWARLWIGLASAAIADVSTYVLVRGL